MGMTLLERAAAIGHVIETERMGPGCYRPSCSCGWNAGGTFGSDDPELLYQRSAKAQAAYLSNEHARYAIVKAEGRA